MFNIVDGILAPCHVARSWHYFARWLHPAMWHVALESWQWIHQVAAPCNVIRGSGMINHWIRPNIRHIGILHLVSISTHHRNRHVILYQSAKFYPNRTTLGRKKRPVDFQDGGDVGIQWWVLWKAQFLHFCVKIQDGGSPPSWILDLQ